jgi:hypothetical protein
MDAIIPSQTIESWPQLVPAKSIAQVLSCTPRYVHILHEQGCIPGYRFGKACIRFNPVEVFAALGIRAESSK